MTHLIIYRNTIFCIAMLLNSLWFGCNFFYVYAVQHSVSLLNSVQQTSIKLQCLKKLFLINWGCLLLLLIMESLLILMKGFSTLVVQYLLIGAFTMIVIALFILYRADFKFYTNAKRSIRPKSELFDKINTLLKFIVILSIINCALLNFV